MTDDVLERVELELADKTVTTSVQTTNDLRFFNGTLQRKIVTITYEGRLPTAPVESWEDIPSVTGP